MTLDEYPAITETIRITITIDPCQITEYKLGTVQADIDYFVGQGELVTGDYDFVQVSNCGYPETIVISGLPGFATSDTTARTFTIETDVFGDVNTYTVRIDSTISVPLDRDDPTNRQEHQQFYTFELNVYDACSSTVFIDTMVINPPPSNEPSL